MERDEARALVERFTAAYNARSLEGVLDCYCDDAEFWDAFHHDGVVGREAIAGAIRELFAANPNERMSIETLAADGTHAVVEFCSTGIGGLGPDVEFRFTEVYWLRDGRIGSCRVYLDPRALTAPA